MKKVGLRIAAPFLVLVATPSVVSARAQDDLSLSARQADFKTFVADFENNYAYLDRSDTPWLTWETRYAAAVKQAESKEAFADVIASALSELHDFHAEVRSRVVTHWLPVPTSADIWAEFTPAGARVVSVRKGSDAEQAGVHAGDLLTTIDGGTVEHAVTERLGPAVDHLSAAARQWALLSVLTGRWKVERSLGFRTATGRTYNVRLPGTRNFHRSPGEITTNLLPGNVGLIRFNNSLGEQKTVQAFDEALAQFQHTAALVLDLRDVPSGGDSSVALGIMGRFVSNILAYQRHRIPHYGQADVERNWVEFVAPRGPFTYTAPVVLLVNHWTGSMGEGMAIGFGAMNRAVVVGTRMAGLAGAVSDEKLPKTGVDVAYATEQIYHVNGTPRQDWVPPVLVSEPFKTELGDPLLDRGLAELRRHSPLQSQPLRIRAPQTASH